MKSKLPLILRIVFGGVLVFAVLVFGGLIPKPEAPVEGGDIVGTVTIWGSFPDRQMQDLLTQFYPPDKVAYVQKEAETLDDQLVEAIAAGVGPDIILLPQDLIIKRQRSLQLISYEMMSERIFKDTYLQQGEVYLRPDGILALPFYIDPMVMYWNRDLFAQAGIVRAPTHWDEIYELTPFLTQTTDDGTITQSAIAFGEYRNVTNAKDLISMLILQLGNPIVRVDASGTTSTLSGNQQLGIPSAYKALEFYTNFSNPRLEESYSWNRGLPESKQMFVNQNLAIYFGYASEYFDMRRINPLLDFDVTVVPQAKDTNFDATIGEIYGAAILASSDNLQGAYTVALTLAGSEFSRALSQATFLPPVRRDLYAQRPTDAFRSVFYQSAIISRGWRDPAPVETNRIFREAVEAIISGEAEPASAVSRMDAEMDLLLERALSISVITNRFGDV